VSVAIDLLTHRRLGRVISQLAAQYDAARAAPRSYTAPFGTPWDALQLGAHAWEASATTA
jgi:hypothetical protein